VRRAGKSQKGKACTRLVKVASFVHTDTKGKDSVNFSGAIGKRVLAPGRYYLEATPQLNGATGKTVTVGFKIMAVLREQLPFLLAQPSSCLDSGPCQPHRTPNR
jgi:hypothetical protein